MRHHQDSAAMVSGNAGEGPEFNVDGTDPVTAVTSQFFFGNLDDADGNGQLVHESHRADTDVAFKCFEIHRGADRHCRHNCPANHFPFRTHPGLLQFAATRLISIIRP